MRRVLLLLTCLFLLPSLASAAVPGMHAGAVLARKRAASCPVPSLSYWQFNESDTTTTAVDSVGANDGTLTNMAGNEWEGGHLNNALHLDGAADFVNMTDIAEISSATTLSACLWVNHDTITTDDVILSKWVAGAGLRLIRDDVGLSARTDIYKVRVDDSADADIAEIESATNASPTTTWTHVCFTYQENTASGLRLYVNGVEDANSPANTTGISDIDSGATVLRVGRRNDGSDPFDGLVDNLKLHEGVWSLSQIQADYNSGVGCES